MQVRDPGDDVRHLLERGDEVAKVLAVSTDLLDRVQPRMAAVPVDQDERGIIFEELRLAPLLQFDDHVRGGAGIRMAACQDRIDPAAAQRQPLLQHDLERRDPKARRAAIRDYLTEFHS